MSFLIRLKIILVIQISFLTVACGQEKVMIDEESEMTPTVYYVPVIDLLSSIDRCEPEKFVSVLDKDSNELFSLCQEDRHQCARQGTCVIKTRDEEFLLNIAAKIDGEFRFKIVKNSSCTYGYGVRNICLDPFYSVAADLKFHKPGDVLYLPVLDGAKLPDGSIHNGYVIVRDSGGGIVGEHRFDFYTGYYHYLSRANPFYRLGLTDPRRRFNYRKVSGEAAEIVRLQRSYPKIPKAKVLSDELVESPHP